MSHGAFIADATAQFARMDIDHNGYLLPEELERYRAPYRQYATLNPTETDANRRRNRPPAAANGDAPDPVMSADTDNRFKVTFTEYIAQADRIFAGLSADTGGVIVPDTLLKTCDPKNGY